MAFLLKIKEAAPAIGLTLTLLGVAFGVVNFIILANLQPITQRVSAVENNQNKIDVIKTDVATLKEKATNIEINQQEINKKMDILIGFKK